MSQPETPRAVVHRNVALLATCQALFMSMQVMNIATSPLVAHSLLGEDKSLATLPLFIMQAGIMSGSIPASLLMGWIGRRAGFSLGAVLGILGGAVATAAIYVQSFEILCAASFLIGTSAAFALYYRFAAADSADAGFRAKAISLVLAGGVAAGLLGPETAKRAVDLLAPVQFAGVYVMMSVFAFMMLLLVQGLRIPMLTAAEKAEGGRPLFQIMRQPTYFVALMSSMFGYGVMTLVMTATPLAMLSCGFGYGASTTVIQAHVIAMFLPSFFTGALINRFGPLKIIALGALIQVGCAAVNLAGIDFMNFFIANALLGLGWNFTYIGGSTLLTSTYRPAERAKAQAGHDFMVYMTTASAAGLAGVRQANAGWDIINMAAIPMMALILVAVSWLALRNRAIARTERAATAAAE